MPARRPALLIAALTLVGGISACSSDSSSSGTSYDVKAGDTTCALSTTTFPAGTVTFTVENTGSDVTEVYVYGKSGDAFTKIMGEVENVGPGTSREFQADLSAGTYEVACKPGMQGEGIRTAITVTGAGGDASATDSSAAYDRELELEIEASGAPKAIGALTAQVGEKIEFKLVNRASAEYYLEVLDPTGRTVGNAEAAASGSGEVVVEIGDAGAYTIRTYADGAEAKAVSQTLMASATS